jgi:hypothetical protein
MLTDARFAHERRHDDDHGPAGRDPRRRHAGGLIVTTSRRRRPPRASARQSKRCCRAASAPRRPGAPPGRVGLPSAIRVDPSGPVCTVSSPMMFRGGRNCPHIVCPGVTGRVYAECRPTPSEGELVVLLVGGDEEFPRLYWWFAVLCPPVVGGFGFIPQAAWSVLSHGVGAGVRAVCGGGP